MIKVLNEQPVVTQIIQNSFVNQRLSHAYLFSGQRGTGKKDMANVLAQLYLCRQPLISEPCRECKNCKRVLSKNHPDVHYVNLDGNSIKKDQIQQLQQELSLAGFESNRKVFIIEHVDKMTTSAANSLLKFLEEPEEGTMGILLTENQNDLLDTIISRCQVLPFLPLKSASYLKQLVCKGIPREKAKVFSVLTNSSTEASDWNNEPWYDEAFNLVQKLTNRWFFSPLNSFLLIHEEWKEHFAEKDQQTLGIELLTIWMKDLLYLLSEKEESVHFVDFIDSLKKQANKTKHEVVSQVFSSLIEMRKKVKANVNFQLALEQATIRIVRGIHA